MTKLEPITYTIAGDPATEPATSLKRQWGLANRGGVDMYVWIVEDAETYAWIDARRWAAKYDLRIWPMPRSRAAKVAEGAIGQENAQ